ncbi:hypothetical protein N7494_001004 [Penicillium frequentans]|uniref:Uncharacterized protein n=1 Tax=Penicillium frequentans TaxID=3151616 RepID=A0AAD6GJH0_9EURO|nr:hypothetical protein N7494_001004 [Penicillium glabrum]
MQALRAGEESLDQLKDQALKDNEIWQTTTTDRAQEELPPFWNDALQALIAETWAPPRAEWDKAGDERKLRAFHERLETMSFGQLTSEDIERAEKKKEDAKLAHQWKTVTTRHVLLETLEKYQLPWKWHEGHHECIVIKQSISPDSLVELFTHSRNLADKKFEEMVIAARSQMEHSEDSNDPPSKL